MAERPRSRREKEEAQRARDLATADDAVLEAGERLVGVAGLLDLAARHYWAWDRQTRWPPIRRAWHSASDCLVAVREIFPNAGVETVFEQVLAAGGEWSHPSQILPRPRPAYRQLADLARRRLAAARGARLQRLADVLEKLEAAADLEETARRRRERREKP